MCNFGACIHKPAKRPLTELVMKIKISEFLGRFYTDLRREYVHSLRYNDHVALFNKYVSRVTQNELQEQSINDFITEGCYPHGWKYPIRLFVNVFHSINVYFYTDLDTDLQQYVQDLVEDDNFRELVTLAFYIEDNVHPREYLKPTNNES